MTTGQLTISAGTQGSASGNRTFGPFSISSQVASDQTTTYALTTGNNTVAVPTGVTVAVVIPPNMTPSNPLSTAVITLGASADTGKTVLSSSLPAVLPLATTQTTLIFNVSAGCSIEVWWM